MTHTQHTPGPWTATEAGVYSQTISRHGNFYIATLPHPNEEPDETDAANLRLIASAPELLEALKLAQVELVTLRARLTEPFASNVAAVVKVNAALLSRIEGGK